MSEKDYAKGQIRKFVKRVEEQLKKDPWINERNTVTKFILPLFKIFGWIPGTDDIDEDYHVKGGRVDIALKIDGVPKLFVEAKPLGGTLSDSQAGQAIRYAHAGRVRWCMLINGREIRIYDTKWKSKGADLFFQTTVEKFEQDFDLLWLLSKRNIVKEVLADIKEKVNAEISTDERVLDELGRTREKLIQNILEKDKTFEKKNLEKSAKRILSFPQDKNYFQKILVEVIERYKPPTKPQRLEKWTDEEIKTYLDSCRKWRGRTYAYFQALSTANKPLKRDELVKEIEKLTGKRFESRGIAGIRAGIHAKTVRRGKEGLDEVNEETQEFSISGKYRNKIKKYFTGQKK